MQPPGGDDVFWLGDTDALVDELDEFVTGVRAAPTRDRVLSTGLFTEHRCSALVRLVSV
jgi:hypothetical protein